MFSRFVWFIRCYFLKKKWNNTHKPHLSLTILHDIRKLIQTLPDHNYDITFAESKRIPSYYRNVFDWMDNVIKIKNLLNRKAFGNQRILPMKMVTINEFLTTDKGYFVNWQSTLYPVLTELTNLHQAISLYPEEEREYYYRHLNELFETGVRFCIATIEEYELR